MASETKLDDLYRAYHDARTRGETPSPEDLCRDCPELVDGLRRLIETRRGDGPAPPTRTSLPEQGPTLTAPAALPPPGLGPEAGTEPVPGYRLTRRLGKGGFGEVWEASAPGGFRVAFKFVPLAGRAGELERRALAIIKDLRHPNLLTIFGTWQTDDWLVIGMELADRTLLDLLDESARRGAAGLEHRSLVRYSLEAAKVIDYLNKPRHFLGGPKPVGIQHGDIKPQNILLVGEGVKVGDFGLVRVLGRAGAAGGMTPHYAAPEVLDGRASRWSDQYALAVTWCQLRGGRLPFTGTTAEVVQGHLHREPDLDMLPGAERAVVARALAKDPRRRWPHCRAFIRALAEAARAAPPRAAPRPAPAPPVPTVPFPPPAPERLPGLARGRLVSAAALAAGVLILGCLAAVLMTWMPAKESGLDVPGPIAAKGDIHRPSLPAAEKDADELRKVLRSGGVTLSTPLAMPPWVIGGAVRPEVEAGTLLAASTAGPLHAAAAIHAQEAAATVLMNALRDSPAEKRGRLAATGGSIGGLGGGLLPGLPLLGVATDRRPLLMYFSTHGSPEPTPPMPAPPTPPAPSPTPTPTPTPPPSAEEPSPPPRSVTEAWWHDPVVLVAAALAALALVVQVAILVARRRRRPSRPAVTATRERGEVREPPLSMGTTPAVAPPPSDDGGGHADAVWAVALSADGRFGASGGLDGEVYLWDVAGGLRPRRIGAHEAAVTAVALAPDGRTLLSGGLDGTLRLWDVRSGRETCRLAAGGPVFTAALSPDGRRVLSGGEGGALRLWDVELGREVATFEGHTGRLTTTAVSPDGRRALSAGEDRTVRVWDLSTGRQLHRLDGGAAVRAATFSPDGRLAATAAEDGGVSLFDAGTGQETAAPEGHAEWARAVAFSPDGRRLLSGGDDEMLRLWDAVSGGQLWQSEEASGSALSLAFAPDGRRVLAGYDDGTVRLVDVPV